MSRWKSIQERVEDYLDARRRMGYKLKIEGLQLHRFARFAKARGYNKALTVELAVAWANATKSTSDITRARRLEVVRGLAKYCALFESETEIPPLGLMGPAHRRIAPHIYTTQEIMALLETATQLQPPNKLHKLRPATLQCLIGLLYATGLRISEALHLTCADIDFDQKFLVVKETKFCKSRYVPLHPTTVEALDEYARLRDQLVIRVSSTDSFFLTDNGRPLNYRQALYSFQTIRYRLGWKTQGKRLPRLYDLRHTFACQRLLNWYKEGVDINKAILLLSVYLGHNKVTDTYWYLTGIPPLMAMAAQRFERKFSKNPEV